MIRNFFHFTKKVGFQNPQVMYNFASQQKKFKNSSSIKQLIYLVKPEWKGFIFAAMFHGIATGVLMYMPKVIPEFGRLYGNKIEKVEEEDNEEEKERKTKKNTEINNEYKEFLMFWGTMCVFSGVCTIGRRYLSMDLGNKIQFRLRNKLYDNLVKRDTNFFYKKDVSTANFVHKLSNDVSVIGNSLSMDLFFGFRSMFFIVGGASYMILKAQALLFPCFIIMSGLTLSTKFIGGYQRKYKMEETNYLTKTSELAHERLSNIKLIKISNTEEQEQWTYFKTLSTYYDKSKLVSYYTALNFGVLEGFGFASLIGIFTYGSYLVTIGVSSPDMVSCAMYAFYVGMGFRGLLNCYTELAKTAGLYDGIKDLVGDLQNDKLYNQPELVIKRNEMYKNFWDQLQERHHSENNQRVDFTHVDAPSIQFNNVTFKYEEYGEKRSLFSNFNIQIPAGKIIAIVGPSGCGKTSLLNLITRLYKVDSGEIQINGENIDNFEKDWVQKNISYVTQEPILLQGTIKENLEYGNQGFDTSFENMQKACQIANAETFINDLPEQYDTVISERGQSLSGGQRQRIILARALIKNPKILIMDEGTANLDQESEKAIIKDLKQICKNRTCILITHKLENYHEIIDEVITLEKPEDLEEEQQIEEQK